MYKKFRESQTKSGTSSPEPDVPKDILEDVMKCWDKIESQKQVARVTSSISSATCKSGWKTVRVFISSTFTDFFNEREALVRKVFPAVKEWAEKHHISLIECDLRWGVPREATTGTAVRVCMEELDRCHEETDGKPFFLLLMGERYGWIPGLDDIPSDVHERYDWVDNTSITHMEILHGAYRSNSPNVGIFMRNPDIVKDIPSENLKRFADTDSKSHCHLQVLKRKLEEKFPDKIYRYDCQVTGTENNSGKEQVVIEGLEGFVEKAIDYIKTSIQCTFLSDNDSKNLNEFEQETMLHDAIMHSKAEFVTGRDEELTTLMQFSEGNPISADLLNITSDSNHGSRSPQILCVSATGGLGKSALLASLGVKAKQSGLSVFYHCVGCTKDSLHPTNILQRLAHCLNATSDDGSKKSAENTDSSEFLSQVMSSCTKSHLVIIDGLNELQQGNPDTHLSWFPRNLPENIHAVVSINSDFLMTLDRGLGFSGYHLKLSNINQQVSKNIVENYFAKYGKVLDSADLYELLTKTSSSSPLWLALACNELRIYGDFTTLPKKIQTLPDSLKALLKEIVSRLLKEDSTGYMSKVLSLLYCSYGGLPESEMCLLLGDAGGSVTPIPLLTWATIRTFLKPFLRSVIDPHTGSLRHQFFHASLSTAVGELLVSDHETGRLWHKELANHYEYTCTDSSFLLRDLPYHLGHANLNQRLKDFFRKDKRSLRINQHHRSQFLQMIRCKKMTHHGNNNESAVICSFCANKNGLFGNLYWRGQDSCFQCGGHLPHFVKDDAHVVKFCYLHSKNHPPNMKQCVACNKMINGPFGPGVPCYICNWCRNIPFQCCFM